MPQSTIQVYPGNTYMYVPQSTINIAIRIWPDGSEVECQFCMHEIPRVSLAVRGTVLFLMEIFAREKFTVAPSLKTTTLVGKGIAYASCLRRRPGLVPSCRSAAVENTVVCIGCSLD